LKEEASMEGKKNVTGFSDEDKNPLPRAVIRPGASLMLDGEWLFALDQEDCGLNENWSLGHAYTQIAHWPGSVEAFMAGHARESWKDKIVVWYERSFPLPEHAYKNGAEKDMLQLTFGACGYETMVWLNGVLLSTIEGKEVNTGKYTSFSYELSEALLLPINRLTVRIADDMNADTTRGKQESHVYKRGGIWYQTTTGAIRSVWIETVPRNRLRSRVGVVSIVEDNLVRINLTSRIHDPGDYIIRLKVYHRKQESPEPIAEDEFPLTLEAGQKQQRVVIEIPDAQLWSPEDPHLYRLVACLEDTSGYIAEIETRIGLRKIEARGCLVYLNNKPIYIDGILYQPGTATYDEIKRHMYAMKQLGCNLVRVHIAGLDPRIYQLADKIGLLLWVEVPSPHASNANSRMNHRNELTRMLSLIESNPSVVIWSLYNESWGVQDIATSKETRQYVIDTYHYMQINHPQFLVIGNDGWEHVSLEGRLKSDILTAHLYTPEIAKWRELLDSLVSGKLTGVAAFPLVVGDPFFFRCQVPLIVSEWGGFGFSDYGGPADDEERAREIRLYKQELRKREIAGDVYTQATNIEDEKNGLIESATGALKVPTGLLHSHEIEDSSE
jgi:beta-galactosidase/beta-glucuronidase